MKNKVLIKVLFPELSTDYDIFIPVNEQVWKVNKLICKTIFDLANIQYDIKNDNYIFFNKVTGKIYEDNEIIINTDIRNGTELVMIAREPGL